MKLQKHHVLLSLLAVELEIPIAILGFSEPLTTFATTSLWALINFWLWWLLCRQRRKLVQSAYLVGSAALVSCLYGVFMILIKPWIYLKVTETQLILNRNVLEITGKAVSVIFLYAIIYRILAISLLYAIGSFEKWKNAQRKHAQA